MSIRISVVIPAYNSGAYIARAVASVFEQRFPAYEVIVVDDGSDDDTGEVVGQFGDKVKYIRQENAGASAARNTGILAASGEWIAFLDADDEWKDDYLVKQVELIERNRELVWTAANFYNCCCEDGHKMQLHDKGAGEKLLGGGEVFEDYFQAYVNGTAGWTGSLMIKKAVLEEAGMFSENQPMANDLDMWWRIGYRYPKIGYNSEPLAVYHTHIADSITKKHRNPEILSDLIAKHLEISRSLGAYERFVPCAVHMIKYWNYVYLFDERKVYIRGILKRFNRILPFSYRSIMNAFTICSPVRMAAKPLVDRISGKIGIRR
ncbi:MAG: glycosyltransferase family 2 protein [Planctomycetes bacterium]|nr:glycosyltransferase family 2 protein [Planctomycetota bacterium]